MDEDESIQAVPSIANRDLQQTIYSAMNQIIQQDELTGKWVIAFPVDDDNFSTALQDLVGHVTDPSLTAKVIIMLVNSLTYWFVEAMMARDPDKDPRVYLADLSYELITKGFGENVLGDQ